MTPQIRLLVDSNLPEIHQMARDTERPQAVRFYAQVLSAFMSGDLEKLRDLQNGAKLTLKEVEEPIRTNLMQILEFRIGLRSQKMNLAQVEHFSSLSFLDVFEAEKYFLLGRAWEALGDDRLGSECSLRAASLYKQFGCPKKSLRAFYNSVVADSRVVPYKNFVSEYQTIIEMSKQVQDLTFAGQALVMLSREYQIAGLLEKALETANEGLKLLEPERGSLHYYSCLLQKAHLHIELRQMEIAQTLAQEAAMSTFPEIQAARKFLVCLMNPEKRWNPEDDSSLLPTWKERLPLLMNRKLNASSFNVSAQTDSADSMAAETTATMLEEKLLKLLWSGPVSKWDLIAQMYPKESDSLLLENRFKNLVARVRKKFPGVLQFQEGRYFVQSKPPLQLF